MHGPGETVEHREIRLSYILEVCCRVLLSWIVVEVKVKVGVGTMDYLVLGLYAALNE